LGHSRLGVTCKLSGCEKREGANGILQGETAARVAKVKPIANGFGTGFINVYARGHTRLKKKRACLGRTKVTRLVRPRKTPATPTPKPRTPPPPRGQKGIALKILGNNRVLEQPLIQISERGMSSVGRDQIRKMRGQSIRQFRQKTVAVLRGEVSVAGWVRRQPEKSAGENGGVRDSTRRRKESGEYRRGTREEAGGKKNNVYLRSFLRWQKEEIAVFSRGEKIRCVNAS